MKRILIALLLVGTSPALAQQAPAPADGRAVALLGPALNVADIAAMKRFYVDGMGMKVMMEMGKPQRHETMLGYEGNATAPGLILMSDQTVAKGEAKTHGTAFDRLVMRVANLPAVLARLHTMGYTTGELREASMGYRMAMATDPEGNRLELVESGVKKAN